ncbi:MAG: hypothetical protein V4787_17150 [Pseudomonadota bacterium]
MTRIYFEDLAQGDVHLGRACSCDEEEMLAYSRLNDPWPFHVDEAAALESAFGGLIASKPGRGLVVLFNEVLNQREEVICAIEAVVLVATRPDAPAS